MAAACFGYASWVSRDGKLSNDDADLRGVAGFCKEVLEVFPGEAEGSDVGNAISGHEVANGRGMGWQSSLPVKTDRCLSVKRG